MCNVSKKQVKAGYKMTFGAKITDEGDLIVPVSYKEFERLSKDSMCKGIDLELVAYRPLLYDENALLLDFWRTQEDITVKQFRDKHKRKHNKICFRYKEPENIFKDYRCIHEIYLEEPDWDISKDSYGNACIRMTWKGINTKQYKQDTPEHSIPV